MKTLILILICLAIFLEIYGRKTNTHSKTNSNLSNNHLSNYQTNNYLMTPTELSFYKQLKPITDNLQLSIFPQVNLERMITTVTPTPADRNRIKSRSIDFTIVNSKNCRIVCCIELDDYTHNREKSKQADEFKNSLFEYVKIPLYRIKVSSNYSEQLKELENQLATIILTK